MKSAGSLILWLLLTLFAAVSHAQQGTVLMELGAGEISIEESVTLTVIANSLEGELDTTALEQHFDIVGRSSNIESQTRISGGKTTVVQTRNWALELMPRTIGNFVVPPVLVGPKRSNSLSLTVTSAPTGAARDIYVEATVDTKTPWVQSQVLLTLRVYQAIEIVDGALGAPDGDALNVEQLGEDRRFEDVRDGRRYAVTERRFAVFPQRSGKLLIDPVRLNVSVPVDPSRARGFFTPTKNIRRQTDSIELDVQARPAVGGSWWLPAQAVTLEERWSADPEMATVDQPLTRTLVLRAVGATATQLPLIERPKVQGLSIYAEEPVSATGQSDNGLISEQRFSWAIIPESAGEQVLPAIAIEWFNTISGQLETVELGATLLRVAPPEKSAAQTSATSADNAASTSDSSVAALSGSSVNNSQRDGLSLDDSTAQSNDALASNRDDNGSVNSQDSAIGQEAGADGLLVQGTGSTVHTVAEIAASVKRWQWISAALLFAWIATLFWIFMQRFTAQKHLGGYSTSMVNRLGAVRDSVRQSYTNMAPLAEVELSCRESDLNAVSQAVLRWAARQFPDQPPRSLSVLADRLQPHPVSDELRALDADLYRSRSAQELDEQRYSGLPGNIRSAIQAISSAEDAEFRDSNTARGSQGRTSGDSHGLPEL